MTNLQDNLKAYCRDIVEPYLETSLKQMWAVCDKKITDFTSDVSAQRLRLTFFRSTVTLGGP